MTNPVVKFAKLFPSAVIPEYAHEGDSGFDFICVEYAMVRFGEITVMQTGLSVEMPHLCHVAGIGNNLSYKVTMELQIRAKSGLAAKHGISLVNGVGTIDFGYRGEILIPLTKVIPGCFEFEPGMKMAQGVFAPVFNKTGLNFKEVSVDELDNSTRGIGGFGSTGV